MKVRLINPLKKLETVIVIIVLLYSTDAWWYVQVVDFDRDLGIPSSPLQTVISYGVYLITFLLIFIHWQRFFYVVTKDKVLLLLVGIALLSIVWTADPENTLKFSKGLIRVTLFGGYLATRYSLKEQIRLYAWALGIAALLSFIVCLAVPSQGIQAGHFGEAAGWRGVFYHKNHLGRLMVFSSGAFLLLAISKCKSRWVMWTGFSLSASLVLLSNSKNALLSFLLILILLPFWKILRQSSKQKLFLLHASLLLGGGIIVGLLNYVEPILNSMGKDMTLTGRIPLWTVLLDKVSDKPWLGYGYNGFWPSEILDVQQQVLWRAGHAHNGFIEMALGLGLFGLLLLMLNLLRNYIRAVTLASLATTAEYLWPLQVMTIIIFVNFSIESTFLKPNIFWMLYVGTSLSLSLQHDRLKKAQFIKSKLFKQINLTKW